MQLFATIVSGVVVYVLGQLIMQFLLEPIKKFNNDRGDVIYYLIRFMNIIDNKALAFDGEDKNTVKEMGAALVSSMAQVPFYDFWTRIDWLNLPKKTAIFDATKKFAILTAKNAKLVVSDHEEIRQVALLLKSNEIAEWMNGRVEEKKT